MKQGFCSEHVALTENLMFVKEMGDAG